GWIDEPRADIKHFVEWDGLNSLARDEIRWQGAIIDPKEVYRQLVDLGLEKSPKYAVLLEVDGLEKRLAEMSQSFKHQAKTLEKDIAGRLQSEQASLDELCKITEKGVPASAKIGHVCEGIAGLPGILFGYGDEIWDRFEGYDKDF